MLRLAVLLPCVSLADAIVLETPPLFNITAASLRDAGLQHGRLARQRIKAYLQLDEMLSYWNYSQGDGADAYESLRRESTLAYPQYAEELRGIAEGAGVDLDRLWSSNLMVELGNLMAHTQEDRCSDIFAISPGGYRKGFAHGHNEDWSQEVAQHLYYIKYTAIAGSDFESCAGLVYPGSLTGWGITWNAHGIFMTVNTLRPKRIRTNGITTAFIQKEAICGVNKGRSLDDVVKGMESHDWADGASINIVDVKARRMANVETWENYHGVVEVSEQIGNYSHFNNYKHLGRGIDVPQDSTLHRQARVDMLPRPQSADEIMSILSDTHDKELPIFRNITMVSHVLDGDTGRMRTWCCQRSPLSGPPVHTWNVLDFWNTSLLSEDATASPRDVVLLM